MKSKVLDLTQTTFIPDKTLKENTDIDTFVFHPETTSTENFKYNDENAIEDIMKLLAPYSEVCKEHMIYTLRHKIAIMALHYEYFGNVSKRITLHDTEKLVLYEHMDTKTAHCYHKNHSIHHQGNFQNINTNKIECVLDYECARYTKPDKPLNARATIDNFYPKSYPVLKDVLDELNINSINNNDCSFENWNQVKSLFLKIFTEINKNAIVSLQRKYLKTDIDTFLKEYNHEISKYPIQTA